MAGFVASKRNRNSSSDDSFTSNIQPQYKMSKQSSPITPSVYESLIDPIVSTNQNELEGLPDPMLEVIRNKLANLTTNVSGNTDLIHLLVSCVIKQSQDITDLNHEVKDLKSRSMRNNVLIHNVPEQGHESMQMVQQAAFKALRHLGIETYYLEFQRVHRLGPKPTSNRSNPRPIVGNFTSSRMLEFVMDNRPRNSYSSDKQPYVTRQYPKEVLEGRRQANHMVDEEKTKDPNVAIKLVLDTLRVNGELKGQVRKKLTNRI